MMSSRLLTAVWLPFIAFKTSRISLPEKSTKPLQKYMDRVFERDAFQASLTEDELEMNE